MSYAAAIDQLSAMTPELHTQPGQQRRKFSLTEIGALLAALGNPHHRFRSVLIAGTNGKGSTASTLASILQASGIRTGLYTSPHLVRPNERIRVSTPIHNEEISDDDFARLYFQVHDCGQQLVLNHSLDQLPSFFETLTAIAFLYFANQAVDIGVLEVGMGGRLDATNIVDPLLSIVTDISLDHTEWLGPTIAAIAREKAGILRAHGTLITLPQHPEANQVLGEVATELGTRAVSAVPYMPQAAPFSHRVAAANFSRSDRSQEEGASTPDDHSYSIQVLGSSIPIDSPLHGDHQHRNIALAIAAAVELATHHNLPITPASIAAGVHSTHWPGRLEVIPTPSRSTSLDAPALNPMRSPSSTRCHPENPRARSGSPATGPRRGGGSGSPATDPRRWSDGGPANDAIVHGVSEDLLLDQAPVDPALDSVTPGQIQWIIDVAHNPAGAWALRAALRSEFGLGETDVSAKLIFSCLRDKPLAEMAQILFPLFSEIIFAPIHSPRATPMSDLLAAAESVGVPARAASSIEEALSFAESISGREAPVARAASTAVSTAASTALRVVAGSVYLVGEIRPLLLARASA
jgi:dihydrofolate synthase/folylpolyglutamate synthase